ncbi:hypothetical protein ACJJTC_000888 [Scirpophaga incertulas]
MLTTRGIPVTAWQIESNGRLITFEVASGHIPCVEFQWEELMKLRDRYFTEMVGSTAMQILVVARTKPRGKVWWTPELVELRRRNNQSRRIWQSTPGRGTTGREYVEFKARGRSHVHRRLYRKSMEEAQRLSYRKIADSGNQDPWRQWTISLFITGNNEIMVLTLGTYWSNQYCP